MLKYCFHITPVSKDSEKQSLIPTAWRRVLTAIVDSIARGECEKLAEIPGVRPIADSKCREICRNVEDYGARLGELPEATWNTSACQWMEGYWEVLVDLFSEEEGASDLALNVRVYEAGLDYSFEVRSIYVP